MSPFPEVRYGQEERTLLRSTKQVDRGGTEVGQEGNWKEDKREEGVKERKEGYEGDLL